MTEQDLQSQLPGAGPIRVLIVDDRDAFAGFVRVVAAGCGYEPRILQYGEKFEDLVAAWEPEIIVLDIIMPDRDGIELIAALSTIGYAGKLILVSGAAEINLTMAATSARDRGLALAATLRKPCRAADLREALRAAAVSANGDT